MSVNKLSAIEAQRAIAVLEECLEKLAFLGSITPDVLAHRDELSQFVGDEISRIIEEQKRLEQKYEELIAQRGVLKGLSNKSKYKQNQVEIQDVSRALRESTKNLCRNLKDNPNISGNLVKIQQERESLQDLLTRTIQNLEDGTFQTLVSQVESDRSEQAKLEDLVRREKETSAAVKRLKDELIHEQEEHKTELAARKKKIAELKEELQDIKSRTQGETNYMRKKAQAKTASILRMYGQNEKQLKQEIEALEKQSETENIVHKETMDFLKECHKTLEEKSEAWENKHMADTESKDKEYKVLTADRERDLNTLQGLQERDEQRNAAEMARLAEERRLAELERLRKEEEARRHAAAIKIQRRGRVYLKQKAESGGKKKGKKGKKKGKKKK
jgi:IQ domain-containing protein G